MGDIQMQTFSLKADIKEPENFITIQAVLGRLYNEESIFLREYRIDENKLIGRFSLPETPWYIKKSSISSKQRHFAAVEMVLCCNQLIYILLMNLFTRQLVNVEQMRLKSFLDKMPGVMVTKYDMTFFEEVNSLDFEASIECEKLFFRKGAWYLRLNIMVDKKKHCCSVNCVLPQ